MKRNLNFENEDYSKNRKNMLKLRFSISEKRKKQLLRETVEQLQSFINENYTISTEVTTIATTIDKKLHDEYQKTVAYPYEEGEVKSGIFEYSQHGVTLLVKWEWVILPKDRDYTSEPSESAYIDVGKKILYIKIISIGNVYSHNGVLESIQHEILHLFERQKRDKPYANISNYLTASKTLNELSRMRAVSGEDERRQKISGCIASIIYMAYKFEQRAFYNGAYRYIMQSRRDAYFNFDELLHETRIFRRLMDVKFCIDELSGMQPNDPFLVEELKKYNLTFQKVLKYGHHLIYRLNSLIVKLRDKVMTDIYNNIEFYPWPESYSPRSGETNTEPKKPIEEVLRKYLS